jgi:ATP-binding cassette subfamily B protein
MMSRIAKNFQDYFTNIIIQRVGAQMYTDGIQKALQLPYQDFEDQRSGETLGKLQKVKSDCEKFITFSISMIFQSLVGLLLLLFMPQYPLVIGTNIFGNSSCNWLLSVLFR